MRAFEVASRVGRVLLALLLVGPLPLSPATITVDGSCSLPDAITAANTDAAVGGCSAGAGTDTVELTGNVTLTEIDNGDNGLPLIASSLGVEGNGFTVRRHPAAPGFRLFEVGFDGTLRLDDVVLTSGSASYEGGTILTRGTLLLENTQITDSYAVVGGAISTTNSGLTTITDSSLSNNYAVGYGGGLYSGYFATTVVTGSTISGNYAGWSEGGGIFAYGAITVSGSTISGNTGDGIHLTYNASTVADSLVKDNTGTGVFSRENAELTLINSTISGNSTSGVGMYQGFAYGSTELINTTVVGNSPYGVDIRSVQGVITLTNTVLAYNSTASCGGLATLDGGGNFDDDGSCTGASPITGVDPVLADNGGPTYTHALLPGSSAVDATADCGLLTDQRGFGRDALCDSGAFEHDASPVVGAAVEGLNVQLSSCSNLSEGTRVENPPGLTSWNCRAQGLAIGSGDRVRQDVRGRPTLPTLVGGVDGIDGATVSCRNLISGQAVQFALDGETSWDCREQGLLFSSSDRVAWTVIGEAQ